jgi:signal peptidase II
MNLTSGELFAHLWPCAGVLLVVADQMSKSVVLARRGISSNRRGPGPHINVCLNRRTGIAGLPRRSVYLLLIVAFCGSFAAIETLPAIDRPLAVFCLSIAVAGAIGNLIDLFRRGAIVDFIDLRIWPVFNLADACIVVGTGGLLWLMI